MTGCRREISRNGCTCTKIQPDSAGRIQSPGDRIYNPVSQMAAVAFLAITGSWLFYQGIYKMYEYRSGYEHSGGLPVNLWIAMGMSENGGVCGWYNNMPKEVLNSLNYDYKATEKAMTGRIEERLENFAKNPVYVIVFTGRKLCRNGTILLPKYLLQRKKFET